MKKVLSFTLTIGLLFSTISFCPTMVSGYDYPSRIITFEDQTIGDAPNISGLTLTPGADNTITVENAYHDVYYKNDIPDGTLTVPQGTGKTLKFARNAVGKTTAIMEMDVGVLPDDFAVGFTELENCDNFKVDLVTENSPTVTICEQYANLAYIFKKNGTDTTNRVMVTQNVWSPFKITFKRSIATPSYAYSITGSAKDEKELPIGTAFDGIDKTKNAKLVFTATLNGGTDAAPLSQYLYLDNIFVNKVDLTPQKNYSFDFEDQQTTSFPAMPGIYTNSYWSNSNKSSSNTTLPFKYTSTAFNVEVVGDPIDTGTQNNVLRSKRGFGSNQYTYQGTTNIFVPKPTSDFSVEFRIAVDSMVPSSAGGDCGFAVYATDGTNKVLPPNSNSTTIEIPATLGKTIAGFSKFSKVVGGDNSAITADVTPLNTWVKVKLVYDLVNGTEKYYINDSATPIQRTGLTAASLKTIFDSTTNNTMTLSFVPGTYISTLTSYYLDDIVVKVDENVTQELQGFSNVSYDESVAGVATVTATVGSGAWLDDGAIVISAVYTSAGDMVDVISAPVSSTDKDVELVLDTSKAGTGYYIRTMLWNSLDSMIPFVDAVTHTAVQ